MCYILTHTLMTNAWGVCFTDTVLPSAHPEECLINIESHTNGDGCENW